MAAIHDDSDSNRVDPPVQGYAIQYEYLLREELALKRSRKELQILHQGRQATPSIEENDIQLMNHVQSLKIRGMLHRASLESMLLAGQCASDRIHSESFVIGDHESGLEEPNAKETLSALWSIKSQQLEEDDLEVTNYIGSSSLEWRKMFSREIDESTQNDRGASSAEEFFQAFPECRRKDEIHLDDSSDNGSRTSGQQQKRKRNKRMDLGTKDEPIIVTCGSNSSSPNHSTEKVTITNPYSHYRKNDPISATSLPCPDGVGYKITNDSDNPSSKRALNLSCKSDGNIKQPPLEAHLKNVPCHQFQTQHNGRRGDNWQSNIPHDPQNAPLGCFDYSESNDSNTQKGTSLKQTNNCNPFLTAKELGNNANENKCHQHDWDGYESTRNSCNPYQNGRVGNNIAPVASYPQQNPPTVVRGPKDNLSEGLQRKFRTPKLGGGGLLSKNATVTHRRTSISNSGEKDDDDELPEELRGLDKELVKKIENEIVDSGDKVTFDDIAGLTEAKNTVFEMVVWPMQRPEIFQGLRAVPSGLLLFGPPGTGKTLIGKAIAHESGATFFSISSSSLTSKWIGEGEKMVRTLFAVARYRSPSVVFIDEVDSMLTARKADENEASRRIKTEFLVQLDGAGNRKEGSHVLVIGATNRPQELDDAARRRFVKRLYIPLPAQPDREILLHTLLKKNSHSLSQKEITKISHDTDGFSGADLTNLCTDAAMWPIRQLGAMAMSVAADDIPPISFKHFRQSLKSMSPSVAQADLQVYLEWNNTYGTKSAIESTNIESDDDSTDESES